ncbi:hypothetical protein RJ640_025599, partial [Escallonia rubra]
HRHIMAGPSYAPSKTHVSVVGPQFCVPHPIELAITRELSAMTDGNFVVTDANNDTVMFKVRVKAFSKRRALVDAAGNLIITFRPQRGPPHHRWRVFTGDSKDLANLLFSAKISSIFQLTTNLNVYLANNTREDLCDFKVEASWSGGRCFIYAGESSTFIARTGFVIINAYILDKIHKKSSAKSFFRGKDKFMVTVKPNVDHAFVVSLVVLLNYIKRQGKGGGGGGGCGDGCGYELAGGGDGGGDCGGGCCGGGGGGGDDGGGCGGGCGGGERLWTNMSLRAKPTSSDQPPTSDAPATTDSTPETPKLQPQSFAQRALSQTLASTGHLANLLPTGTLLAFQLLTPIFTNNGACDSATRPMTFLLLALLTVSCFLACFTDSFKSPDDQVYYGFATFKGMCLFDYPVAGSSDGALPDFSLIVPLLLHIMAGPSYAPSNTHVSVVGPQFCVPYPIQLAITRKLSALSNGNFVVTDANDTVMFKVRGKAFSKRRTLVDAAGNPIITFRPKWWTSHHRWRVFTGDSKDLANLLFSAKISSIFQLKTKILNVYLANNTREHFCDFKVVGSWSGGKWTIYAGESSTIIAQMHKKCSAKSFFLGKDKFMVTVNPNVDYAFVVSLVVLLDYIKRQGGGDGGSGCGGGGGCGCGGGGCVLFYAKIYTKMSLRAKPTSSDQPPTSDAPATTDSTPETPKLQPQSFAQRALSQTLASTGQLANLLPTGTLLAFQLLTPIFTNNGACDSATRPMTFLLLAVLTGSCFLACFTDSFKSLDGQVYYGFATFNGMWLFDYPVAGSSDGALPDLRKYRLRFIDMVHAVLSVLVFGAVALKDKNVLSCFYPTPTHETQEVLDIGPVDIIAAATTVVLLADMLMRPRWGVVGGCLREKHPEGIADMVVEGAVAAYKHTGDKTAGEIGRGEVACLGKHNAAFVAAALNHFYSHLILKAHLKRSLGMELVRPFFEDP